MTAVLLYDGDCRFCSTCARALQRWVQPDCLVLPYQQVDLVRLAVIGRPESGVSFVRRDAGIGVDLHGVQAVAAALDLGRTPWPIAGAALRAPVLGSAAAVVYRLLAASGGRLPGGTPTVQLDRAAAVGGTV